MLGQATPAVPLLGPWVAAHVISVLLPEPGHVIRQELEPAHPLRALPEVQVRHQQARRPAVLGGEPLAADRKSTRLNSSHRCISYAVFCLKKKKERTTNKHHDK